MSHAIGLCRFGWQLLTVNGLVMARILYTNFNTISKIVNIYYIF
jgi:hypothetical protein